MEIMQRSKLAVLIPCYNEAPTIKKVVQDFKDVLPEAAIFVFDNNSTDHSDRLAEEAGAVVIKEKKQGKGFVVASMLTMVDADYYLMVDADDTYPADQARSLLLPLMQEKADMVVGKRLSNFTSDAFRPLHIFGNKLVCRLINLVFDTNLTDPMSGYRSFTREVAQSLPVVAGGFDIETEMTLQLLYRHFIIHEVDITYRNRPHGSVSKLNTVHDGFKVLLKILTLFRAYKPFTFFGMISLFLILIGGTVGIFPIIEYIRFQYVYSVPKAILASGIMILAALSFTIGIILDSINLRILELNNVLSKQIRYNKNNKSG
ncbi:MAG: glycosyl transferase [Anaerolineaceae bacterium]|nr:glycosyl transferase [Anaerolineaceae bacterium]